MEGQKSDRKDLLTMIFRKFNKSYPHLPAQVAGTAGSALGPGLDVSDISVRPVIATSYTPLSAPTDSVHNIQTPHHWDEVTGRQNNSPHFCYRKVLYFCGQRQGSKRLEKHGRKNQKFYFRAAFAYSVGLTPVYCLNILEK